MRVACQRISRWLDDSIDNKKEGRRGSKDEKRNDLTWETKAQPG